jgi:3-methyladenine DNA glycosylase/8-oxoguanine DNA glycosylase
LIEPDVRSTFFLDRPVDLHETLWQARLGPTDPTVRVIDGDVWRASHTPVGPATERLRTTADGAVQVDAWGPGAEWLIERAPILCGALDQPASFQPQDALLQRLSSQHAGLRIGRTEAVFEAAMGSVLEQRVATPDAWRSWRHMVISLGEPAPGPLRRLWVPPSAERVARLPYEVFHRFGVERRRADIIRRLAVVARRLEDTTALPLDAAYLRLQAVPGIGAWTSARIALIALGDADAVMVGDLHLPHLVAWALAGETRGSDARMLELLEPFRGHRGRVTRLLATGRLMARAGARL